VILLVMLGAGIGAACRWLLDQAVQNRHDRMFPWGTFTVNMLGSFALGVLLGAQSFGQASAELVLLLGVGFCGGFTTFSTFTFETVRLVEQGSWGNAAANVIASVGVGLLAAIAGWQSATLLWQ